MEDHKSSLAQLLALTKKGGGCRECTVYSAEGRWRKEQTIERLLVYLMLGCAKPQATSQTPLYPVSGSAQTLAAATSTFPRGAGQQALHTQTGDKTWQKLEKLIHNLKIYRVVYVA